MRRNIPAEAFVANCGEMKPARAKLSPPKRAEYSGKFVYSILPICSLRTPVDPMILDRNHYCRRIFTSFAPKLSLRDAAGFVFRKMPRTADNKDTPIF
jgi:hypothetical protein